MAKKEMTKTARRRQTVMARQQALTQDLEAVQMEKQVLGMTVTQHTNEQLFVVDTLPQAVPSKAGPVKRPLRVDEILKPHSKTNAPPQRLRAELVKQVKKLPKLKLEQQEGKAGKDNVAPYDLWADEPTVSVQPKASAKPAMPAIKAAVKVAPAGASYRPDPAAHQQLLEAATQQELKRLDRYEGFKAQVAPIFTAQSTSLDLGQQPWAQPELEQDESSEQPAEPVLTITKAKSKAERRQEIEARLAKEKRREEKRANQLLHQLDHLRSIRAQVKTELAAQKPATKKQQKSKIRLGPDRLMDIPLPVQLEDELAGSLRQLKPEGHLLVDRFHSLQERGVIEPRHRIKAKRRYLQRVFVKHGHKQFQ